jgi:hypothetical protein
MMILAMQYPEPRVLSKPHTSNSSLPRGNFVVEARY